MGRHVACVVSGGQTGVDRAALDAALRLGLPYAGWCPSGGWAEDLPTPPGLLTDYPRLRETGSTDPAERTRLNVRDSDATLVVWPRGVRSPGTAATVEVAEQLGRPVLVVATGEVERARAWLGALARPVVLNVAGPRESEAPGVHGSALADLCAVLGGD